MKNALTQLIFLIVLLTATKGMAQRLPQNKPVISREEADSLRVDVMTKELKLSPDESKKFWPVFYEYTGELQNLDQEYFHRAGVFRKNIDRLNDTELNQFLADEFNFQERKLELKKKYNNRLRAFLPVRKLAHYYLAQEQFSRQLIRFRIKKGLSR